MTMRNGGKSYLTSAIDEIFYGHVLCSLCGHEMAMHDSKISNDGVTSIVCYCTEKCFCGKGPMLPYGYWEVKRKQTAANYADIVLGRSADGLKWVTMRYNPTSGRHYGIHAFIGTEAETRARLDYSERES